MAKQCLDVNYYGAKRMVESFLPLLGLSDSPRIVNVSSVIAKLSVRPLGSQNTREIKDPSFRQTIFHFLIFMQSLGQIWAKEVLTNAETLTEEKVDEVVEEFLKDFKEGLLEAKGWPIGLSAYHVSKVTLNAYTRVLSSRLPAEFCVNCVCPGFVKTDLNCHTGFLNPEEGAESPVILAMLPKGGPSGQFFVMSKEESF